MTNLAGALIEALAELTVVKASRTANTGTYSYDYADIADVVKLTRPVLAEHGLVALTPVHDHNNGLACTVTILHSSGERMDFGPFPFPHGRDAQATGSMVTYHRRYALISALGMAAGDDDDGHAAKPRDPNADAVAAGFDSEAHRKAEHKRVDTLARQVPEENREPLRKHRKAHPWPTTAAALHDFEEMCDTATPVKGQA
jgi:hypothetical protein